MCAANLTSTVWSTFAPDRSAEDTLQDQIYVFFRNAISVGRLRPGERLPSTRALAKEIRLGRNTVSIAFDR